MAGYGWTAYDTRKGGTQTIPDIGNKINITTEFVKMSEGQSRGNWGLRVRGTPREGASGLKTSVVFYVAMEGMDKCEGCRLEAGEGKVGRARDREAQRKVVFWMKNPGLGISEMHLPIPKFEVAAVKSVNMTEDVLWKSKCKCFLRVI
jgi:mannosyl-oligosaccharide glucosidase